jgi:hypothetical protein
MFVWHANLALSLKGKNVNKIAILLSTLHTAFSHLSSLHLPEPDLGMSHLLNTRRDSWVQSKNHLVSSKCAQCNKNEFTASAKQTPLEQCWNMEVR